MSVRVISSLPFWYVYIFVFAYNNSVFPFSQNSNQDGEDENTVNVQKQKIGNLFFRQLSLPFLDMEKTYEELQKWLETEKTSGVLDIESLERNYKKALDKLSRVLDYETALVSQVQTLG